MNNPPSARVSMIEESGAGNHMPRSVPGSSGNLYSYGDGEKPKTIWRMNNIMGTYKNIIGYINEQVGYLKQWN